MQQFDSLKTSYPAFDSLCRAVYSGRCTISPGIRFLFWKACLLHANHNRSSWVALDKTNQLAYKKLRDVHPLPVQFDQWSADRSADQGSPPADGPDTPVSDPLSDPDSSASDLMVSIFQDVDRTFPEVAFFRSPAVLNVLARILFVYASASPDIGYRQGMHEIAAPLLHSAMSLSHAGAEADSAALEADTYFLFAAVMGPLKQTYTSAVIERSKHIQNDILGKCDPHLREVLVENAIEPQIWGIRWLRLLFSREFGFDKTLLLWDALFATGIEIADYLCAVLIIRLRPLVVNGQDYSEILISLLNYPWPENDNDPPHVHVVNAIYLRSNLDPGSGHSIAMQYAHLWREPHVEAHTPVRKAVGLGFESFLGAAKSVSKNLDIDRRVKEALDETRRIARDFGDETRRRAQEFVDVHERRDDSALVKLLDTALANLHEGKIENAIGSIVKVRDSLVDGLSQKKSATNAQPSASPKGSPKAVKAATSPAASKKSPVPIKNSSASATVESKEPYLPRRLSTSEARKSHQTPVRVSLAQSEFAWMLGTPRAGAMSGFKPAQPASPTKKEVSDDSEATLDDKDLFEMKSGGR